ncbi:SurA N-terminal domain-containing protein [Methyloceanibacter sp.]|uniref:SurA N-terminal domain-containing protein n=1 Tax=Methyloceanibacter sp. TaxID=1965321 RepID=UPI002C60FE95|nr:SurA N-terminal domain-containing protein [Methyloceanibacter sp.]HML92164.1 SurA N-terminal domain-containing protein [Methyloceanibacter sp.]
MTNGPTKRSGSGLGTLAAAGMLVLAALVLAAHPVQAQDVAIKILVNDDPISDYDISQRERFLMLTAREQPGPELTKKATEMLVTERLQLQEGRKLGITPSEADVNRVLDDMASRNNLDANGLATALQRSGVNISTLKNRIGAQMVWQRVIQQKFRREVQISDAQIDEALSQSSSGSSSGGIKQIRLPLPSGADQRTVAAKVAEAENLRARFRGCGNVQSLAKGVDGATIRALKVQDATTLGSPARILVRNAKVGQMTPPTVTRAAVELYAVCGADAPAAAGDLNVRDETERKIMNEELVGKADEFMKEIRDQAFIEYR